MKTRKIILAAVAAALTFSASAQESHIKWYGFIRNYFAYDTRECVAGTEDFFMYVPKDVNMKGDVDLNEQSSFRFAAITSRLGVDVSGYEYNGFKIGAKIETDFYNGVSGVTGTAVLRLRQAYVTLAKNNASWKIGQAWHPMAADMPDVFSLNTGAPFGPFSRTPLVNLDYNLSKSVYLTGAAIWQMQYVSAGPPAASANFIKYSCIPELYLGLSYKDGGFIGRAGVDVLSIKPRNNNGSVKVKDRITTVSPFLYAQYKTDGGLTIKAKTIYAQAGEHFNLNGGYGVCAINSDDSYEYTPTRNSSSWLSLSYGKNLQWVLFAGYVKNFGTTKELVSADKFYFSKNSFSNFNSMWRLTPTVIRNMGKFAYGLECELTSVQYGDAGKMNLKTGLCDQDLHWVTNTRLQALVKYTF